MEDFKKAILINNNDNVATALSSIKKDDRVNIIYNNQTVKFVIALDDVDIYHKIAIKDIQKGNEVFKYGEIIGKAVQNISIGQHVHVNNIESVRVRK